MEQKLIEDPLYGFIYKKILSWIKYRSLEQSLEKSLEHLPKSAAIKARDEFRAKNDLDCILNDGNLNADTIFSLWLPLRLALVNVSGYAKIKKVTGFYGKIEKSNDFLETLFQENTLFKKRNLEILLPCDSQTTILLSELFEYGQLKANTMILPDRKLQQRGAYDYMPHFLKECFLGNSFSYAFQNNDVNVIKWIQEQKLEFFFNGEICQSNIKDLSHTGNLDNNVPNGIENLNKMFEDYITILKMRKEVYPE